MSKRHTLTLHHVITVYNDKFNHMDGVMKALAKKKTLWKEDLNLAVKLARQELSKYYAEVTPTTGMLFISAHILDRFRKLVSFEIGIRDWILILRPRYRILPNTKRPFGCMVRMNIVPNIDVCRSISTNAYGAAISSHLQRLQDLLNHPLIHMICQAMKKNTYRLTMRLRRHQDEAIEQHVY